MLRFLTAGESHGQGLIALIEYFPSGFEISIEAVNRQLARRQQGYGRGKRMQIEKDRAVILSGLRHGRTIGSPIACLIENKDWPKWEKVMDPHVTPSPDQLNHRERHLTNDVTAPRPGHADLAGGIKYDTHDLRNILERASARETAARVAAGSVARQLLEKYGIQIASHVLSIGSVRSKRQKSKFDEILAEADASPVRCIDPDASETMKAEIKQAIRDKDTLGGVFEVRVAGLPVGLGSTAQWYTRLDGALAAAMMSIQSVKGVEIGDGFGISRKRGSKAHDQIYYRRQSSTDRSKNYYRRTNHAGGLEGGITNGTELVVRAACKPISTLMQPMDTVDVKSREKVSAMVERSDTCVVPAAAVIGEAMAAMVLASAFTDKFGHDSRTEIDAAFDAYLNREF
jgi:chorismate synthase